MTKRPNRFPAHQSEAFAVRDHGFSGFPGLMTGDPGQVAFPPPRIERQTTSAACSGAPDDRAKHSFRVQQSAGEQYPDQFAIMENEI